MKEMIKFYDRTNPIRMIESDNQILYFDIFVASGEIADLSHDADLSGGAARFHLMEFATRELIWTKDNADYGCYIVSSLPGTIPNRVIVQLFNKDTVGLEGHYVGQLELIDKEGESKFPIEVEIIIAKAAQIANNLLLN